MTDGDRVLDGAVADRATSAAKPEPSLNGSISPPGTPSHSLM